MAKTCDHGIAGNKPCRYCQILLLLRCREDFDFDGVRDSLASLKTLRGPSPSRKVECPDCRGKGEVKRRGFPVPCPSCGDGEQKGRGWIMVDSMLEEQWQKVGTASTETVQRTCVVTCDGCGGSGVRFFQRCEYCFGSGKIEIPMNLRVSFGNGRKEEKTGDPRIDAGLSRDRYSFPELRLALRDLFDRNPRAFIALEFFLAGRKHHRPFFDEAMQFLDEHLPAKLKLPGYAKAAEDNRLEQLKKTRGTRPGEHRTPDDRKAIAARDREIRRLRSQGKSVEWIVGQFSISASRVYQVLEEERVA